MDINFKILKSGAPIRTRIENPFIDQIFSRILLSTVVQFEYGYRLTPKDFTFRSSTLDVSKSVYRACVANGRSIPNTFEIFPRYLELSWGYYDLFLKNAQDLRDFKISKYYDSYALHRVLADIFDLYYYKYDLFRMNEKTHCILYGLQIDDICAMIYFSQVMSQLFHDPDDAYSDYCERAKFYDELSKTRNNDPRYQLFLLRKMIFILKRIPSFDELNFPHTLYPAVLKEVQKGCSKRLLVDLFSLNKSSYFKEKFGSWFKALIEAKVLPDGQRKTRYGTFVISKCGHQCRSISELNVCNWFFDHGVIHEKEVKYPASRFIADWKVGDIYVEYFGLKGIDQYDKKTATKIAEMKRANVKLIEIYSEDLQSLDEKLDCLANDVRR